jgi:hypothetical protein
MHRVERSSAAQALVESALALPLVVALTLGVVQVVLYAHARAVLTSAVQEGARLAAEDGRRLDEGFARARAVASAGLGRSVDPLRVEGMADDEVVVIRAAASMRPILPLPSVDALPVQAESHVARERFRPGGAR